MSVTQIKEKALQLGYSACGIIPATAIQEYSRQLDERVKLFPDSKHLYDSLYGLAKLPIEARSIIVAVRRFNKYRVPESLIGYIGKIYMFDGRLPYTNEFRAKAEFDEYLKTTGLKLLQAGVPARLASAKAGLGKFGRNNSIYTREHGSLIWIDTWVIDKELDYDKVADELRLSECGENCGLCIRACPTKALSGSYSMDRGKCIPEIVCFTKETPDAETSTQMGLWLYGCDACQDACPLNKGKFTEQADFPLLNEIAEYLEPEKLLEMDEDTYINIVQPRFWYIGKDSLWLWKRNVLRCMINSGDKKYHHLIVKYCEHENACVKETAQWGRNKLAL